MLSMYAIECDHLSKTYRQGFGQRSTQAVVDLTLQIEAGQIYGFLGPNGAGKTTTIRMMLDLIRPTSGGVRLFGQPIRRSPAALKSVGALVEGASFYPYLSGWDNLRVCGWTSGAFDAARARQLLAEMDLLGREQDAAGKYSTGMKQRLGIVAALLHNPQLVILDEPTNGLDPAGIREMRGFIRRLADVEGKTVFLSSHLLGEVQQICDRVAIINSGRLLAEGRVDDLLQQQGDYHVHLKVLPLEKAQAVLRQHWQLAPNPEADTLTIIAAYDDIPAVVRALAAADVDLYALHYDRANLEDFFLSVTGGDHVATV